MFKTTIVIPTYNEAENVPLMADAIFKLAIEGVQLLVVDDDSPDGTATVTQKIAEKYPGKVHLLHRVGRRGLGSAYVEGFRWALEAGSDYIVQMDADFSHPPEQLPVLLRLIADHDVVVGSRYVPGGRLDERWGWQRRFLSWWANSVWVRFWLGLKTHDATAGYKCWRAAALQQIDLGNVYSNGYGFMVEMCYLAERAGLRICETPIYFRERDLGKSKMSLRVQLHAAVRVLEIRQRHNKH
ncbi:MAG: polyprenol monophosphomannose synthase [Chloroflexota bacterium]